MKILFDHYAIVEKLYTQIASPICKKYNLTFMEYTVLMLLTNKPGYNTATQLVKMRHLTKSHVSISIRSLEEKGLLIGEYKNDNHRTIYLSLTDNAAPIIKEGLEAQKKFVDVLFDGFSEEEREAMENFIARVDKNMENKSNELFGGE